VSYADRSPSPEAASYWGFIQISLLACNLAFNMSIFIYTLAKLLIGKILDFTRRFT
jgi:Na+/H+ antiporter NhaA